MPAPEQRDPRSVRKLLLLIAGLALIILLIWGIVISGSLSYFFDPDPETSGSDTRVHLTAVSAELLAPVAP